MATITNQSQTTYQFDGSSEVLTTSSNINEVTLEENQGLILTKTASPTTFVAGSIITYTVTITNSSSSFLTGVRIIDNLGANNLAYVLKHEGFFLCLNVLQGNEQVLILLMRLVFQFL